LSTAIPVPDRTSGATDRKDGIPFNWMKSGLLLSEQFALQAAANEAALHPGNEI
jgi:hypothetical protein